MRRVGRKDAAGPRRAPGRAAAGSEARPWLRELRGAAPRCSGEAPSLGRCSITPGMLHRSQGAPSLVRCFVSCVNRGLSHLW